MDLKLLEERPFEELSPEEGKALVAHYEQLAAKYTAYEQAVKLSLNSIYDQVFAGSRGHHEPWRAGFVLTIASPCSSTSSNERSCDTGQHALEGVLYCVAPS